MRFDNLNDWLHWQETLHPSTIELGLSRVESVWARLGPMQLPFPVITIAGTNGKGSCAAMLEAVYAAAGYRTGCYTSPHLLRYNERIRIDAREVCDQALCAAFDRVEEARGETSLTYFEFGTLAAMDLFVRGSLDVAILEVGLGGRLDAVNLFDADLALITSIGRDHTAWLGETLAEIAREKGGILRSGRPAVIGHREPVSALLAMGEDVGCRMHLLGRDFDWEAEQTGWRWTGSGLAPVSLSPPALRGKAQYDNAAAVLMSVSCLGERLPVSLNNLRQGLQRAQIPGRFQVWPGEVTWILDVAHNAAAATALAENLKSFNCAGRMHAVFGMLADKEPEGVAGPLMEWVDLWHLGQADNARALPVEDLRAVLQGLGCGSNVNDYLDIEAAMSGARRAARAGDCILAFGSFTTVEAVLRRVQNVTSRDREDTRLPNSVPPSGARIWPG